MHREALVRLVLASLLLAPTAQAAHLEAGNHPDHPVTGRVDVDYPVPGGHVPLLERFILGFRNPHHLGTIMVMPGGEAEDRSPNAGIGLPNVDDGKLAVILKDKDEDDKYDYRIWHQTFSGLSRFNVRAVGCTGRCEHRLPHPQVGTIGNVFVLVGFQLFFTGQRDRPMDKIGVFEENGDLVVVFSDKNGDDVFAYSVDYAMVPRHRIQELHSVSIGVADWGALQVQPGIKVLRGFQLDFKAGPEERDIVGLDVGFSGDILRMVFADGSMLPAFDADIDWAVMRPPLVVDPNPGGGP